jgi:hypothetical protein
MENVSDSGTVGSRINIEYIFCDRQIKVMEWFFSVMLVNINKSYLVILEPKMNISTYSIVDSLSTNNQTVAFQKFYEASLHYGFEFPPCYHVRNKITTVSMLQCWYDIVGTDEHLFCTSFISQLIFDGRIDMLDKCWELMQHSIPFKYELDLCSQPILVLNWLWDHRHQFEFTYEENMLSRYWIAYDHIYGEYGDVKELLSIINWLWDRNTEIEFKYEMVLFSHVSNAEFIHVLEWFVDRHKSNDLQLKCVNGEYFHSHCIDYASIYGFTNILDFFYLHRDDFGFNYTSNALDYGCIESWNWFYERMGEIEFKYSEKAILNCITRTMQTVPQVVDLGYINKTPLCTTRIVRTDASAGKDGITAVKWWYDRRDVVY